MDEVSVLFSLLASLHSCEEKCRSSSKFLRYRMSFMTPLKLVYICSCLICVVDVLVRNIYSHGADREGGAVTRRK